MAPKLNIAEPNATEIAQAGFNVTEANLTISDKWWEGYNDPTLNALVEEALNHNKDLEIALLNISLARASMAIKDADYYPALSAKAGATRTQTSPEAYTSQGRKSLFNDFSLSAILTYEVDLWGRVASSTASAKASLLASKASADAVRLSLAANVVDSYFVLVSLKEQLDLTTRTLKTREETYNITKIRYDAGAESETVLAQQESLLAAARITKNTLEQQLSTTSSAMGVLLGRSVGDLLVDRNITISKLPDAIELPRDIPSTIIEKRPDVEASFQNMVSSNYLIGVARAAYFPTLSLSGLFGLDSADTDTLLKSNAKTWNAGAALAAPLIDFGRTSNNVEMAKISTDIAAKQYEKTVLTAFGEVYNAMRASMLLDENFKNAQAYEQSLQKVRTLTQYQYDAGYADYLNVLDSERSLLGAKLSTIQTHQALLSSGVALFKALGGGWDRSQVRE
jgi:multidrug efflux system outer membrane protein